MAQRGLEGSLNHSLLQQGLQLTHIGEIGAALQPELDHAGILAAGSIQLDRQILVLGHGFVQDLGQGCGLLAAQLLQLGHHVVRQLLADVAYKAGHHVRQTLNIFFLCHKYYLLFFNCRTGTEWAKG